MAGTIDTMNSANMVANGRLDASQGDAGLSQDPERGGKRIFYSCSDTILPRVCG